LENNTSCSTVNSDDFVIDGLVTTLIADEDLLFGDYVEYSSLFGNQVTVKKLVIEDDEVILISDILGRVIESVKKGEPVKILLSGMITPKKDYTKHMKKLKEELLVTIFTVIGNAFGYDLSIKSCDSSQPTVAEDKK